MTRGILLAGTESPLSAAIAAEAAKRVESFAAAFIPNRFSHPGGTGPSALKGHIPLAWNPGSPISARALALAAENRMAHIDEAVLICVPPGLYRPPEELSSTDIETLVNDYIKGWFFLSRELIGRFKARQAGVLTLVLSEPSVRGKDEPVDVAGGAVAAAFRALAQSLLAASAGKPYQVLGFSGSGEPASFAAFIFKILEEGGKRNGGKWHKFGKIGLFGR
ncbi:MAG: hypothetical protein LBU28_03985 [Spirochaetaceae bacterium]|jgi:hypothetical protein|nr:hypothetical protein [Spirochaetaceae bacterium]